MKNKILFSFLLLISFNVQADKCEDYFDDGYKYEDSAVTAQSKAKVSFDTAKEYHNVFEDYQVCNLLKKPKNKYLEAKGYYKKANAEYEAQIEQCANDDSEFAQFKIEYNNKMIAEVNTELLDISKRMKQKSCDD